MDLSWLFTIFGKSTFSRVLSGMVIVALVLAIGGYLNRGLFMEYFEDAAKHVMEPAAGAEVDDEKKKAEAAAVAGKEGFYGAAPAGEGVPGAHAASGPASRAANLGNAHAANIEAALSGTDPAPMNPFDENFAAANGVDDLAGNTNLPQGGMSNNMPVAHAFPRAQMNPADLLPNADVETQWAAAHPKAQGELGDKNQLEAGHHIGLDTIGSTNRIPNYDLRSRPPNPQEQVSIWNQSTVAPNEFQRSFEIGN